MTERASPPTGWLLARRYQDESAAVKIYEAALELLFVQDLDASVLRFVVNESYHVALIGDVPLTEEARCAIDELLEEDGEQAELPPFAADDLREHRARLKDRGFDGSGGAAQGGHP